MSLLSGIWSYRNFILTSIKGELKGRFSQSRIGAAWFLLHPLAQATIFAIVLAEVLAAKIPGVASKAGYAIYLMAGMAAWSLFSELVNRSMSVFLEYSSAMKKIAFPRICLPLIVGGGALLNHVLLLFALAVVFLFFGHLPGGAWIALILGAFLIAALGFGLGILLGVFNVFARDVGYVFGIVLQFWFWLTPIVYTANVLPDRFQKVIAINPMTPLVQVYQDALLLNKWPAFETLIYPALLAAFLVGFAFFVFRQASAELVDAL